MSFMKNLKAMKEQVAAGMRGEGPTEEQLAALSPEQRAAYDAQMARVDQQLTQSNAELDSLYQAQIDARPLSGPAGHFLYGADPRETSAQLHQTLQQGGLKEYMKASWKATSASTREQEARESMDPQPVSEDHAQQVQHEWSVRERARAPYLAPARFPVLFTRIATRVDDAPDAVRTHLARSGLAARPELVFGVYPVPDHIGHGLTRGKKRYQEWDVVHAAREPLAPAAEPAVTFVDAGQQWVARASGDPSVLDEDLAITLLMAAGVGPERCTGIARAHRTAAGGGGEDTESYVMANIAGTFVCHPDDGSVASALEQMRTARPIVLPAGPPPGVHVEVLNWRAIADAVQRRTGIAFLVPSPFPYLPSTPQELIKAYIDIVGVNPFDSYAAHVSEDANRNIKDRSGSWVTMERSTGQVQPCVDGKPRARLTGGSVVVIAYRDRPEYEEGRRRWSAYETEVLQSRLANGTGTRAPVTSMQYGSLGSGTRRILNRAEKVAGFVDDLVGDGGSSDSPFDRTVPHRYCWPPTDVR